MELVPTGKNEYEEYESLLLRRDACRKRARGEQVLYIKEFGDLITRSFQKKVDCIAKKKILSYYQAAANRGETVRSEDLDAYLQETMKEYYVQLDEMLEEYGACREAQTVPEDTVLRVKALYRKIAKRIHPDTHPAVVGDETLTDLWGQVVEAYRQNDRKALEDLEVLVSKVLRENGDDAPEIAVPNLEERMDAVRAEIKEITSTDPYLYGELLKDPKAVEEKKRALQEEIDEYQAYGEELDQILQTFMEGEVFMQWPMN